MTRTYSSLLGVISAEGIAFVILAQVELNSLELPSLYGIISY